MFLRRPRKILLLDVDNCLLLIEESKEFFSPPLLNFIKKQKYDAFYICTHRHFSQFPEKDHVAFRLVNRINNINKKRKESEKITPEQANNIFLSNIVKNLEKRIGLSCLKVSTPDDHHITNTECGYGFENIIQHFENELIQQQKEEKEEINYPFQDVLNKNPKFLEKAVKLKIDYTTKNNQIKQILKHASKTYPNHKLTVDFIDDVKEICTNALKMSWEEANKAAPKLTQLSVYNHDAYYEHDPKERAIDINEINTEIALNMQNFEKNENSILDLDIKANGKEGLSEKEIGYLARLRVQQTNIKKLISEQRRELHALAKQAPVAKLGTIKSPSYNCFSFMKKENRTSIQDSSIAPNPPSTRTESSPSSLTISPSPSSSYKP